MRQLLYVPKYFGMQTQVINNLYVHIVFETCKIYDIVVS